MKERIYLVQVGGKRASRFAVLPRVQIEEVGGGGAGKLVGLGVLVVVGLVVKHQWPEIRRYLKMCSQ